MESMVYAISPLVSSSRNLTLSGNHGQYAFVDDVASLTPVSLPAGTEQGPTLVSNYSFDMAGNNYVTKSPSIVSSSTNPFQAVTSGSHFDTIAMPITTTVSAAGNSSSSQTVTVDSTTGNGTLLPNVLTFSLPPNRAIIQPAGVQHILQEPSIQPVSSQQLPQQQQYNIAASSCGAKVIILSSSATPLAPADVTLPPQPTVTHIPMKITDTPARQPPPSRARDSLPLDYLYFKPNNIGGFGVFAAQAIAAESMLGPIEGTLAKYNDTVNIDSLNRIASENIHSLTIFFSETYVLSQESADNSNWTRFVRPATTVAEQNLELFESLNNNELKFFFQALRPIQQNEELRVWYSKEICSRFKIDTIEQRSQSSGASISQPEDSSSGHKLRNKIAKVAAASSSLPIIVNVSKSSVSEPVAKKTPTKVGVPVPTVKASTPVEHRCETCSKVFPRASNLQRHIAAMHSAGAGTKQFKCPICSQEFNHVYNRNRHMKNKHNLAITSDSPHMVASPILIPIKSEPNGGTNTTTTMMTNHVVIVAPPPGMNTPKTINRIEPQPTLLPIEQIKVEPAHKVTKMAIVPGPKTIQIVPETKPKPDSSSAPSSLPANSVLGKILSEPVPSSTDVFGVKSTGEFKSYRCPVCYKRFSTADRLEKHAMVHDESAKKLQCNVCRRKFLTASALSCHTKTHSYSELDPRTYDCPLCDQVFNTIQTRRDHALVHIKPETKLYHCPKCSKTFSDFTPIRKHMRSFHSDEEFPCSQCDKVFPRQDKLRLHMLCHTDHCEFKCEHCDKQFKRKDKLKEHKIRMHAPDRNERIAAKIAARMQRVKPSRVKKQVAKPSQPDYENYSFKCQICRLGFKRRGMLVNHLAKRHPDVPYDSVPELLMPIVKTSKDYFCQYCEKIYKSSSKRKAHILKNHPGESLPPSNRSKNLPSDHPNPTYSATVGSIAIEPHFCPWCHKQYASKAKLMQHQRKKHADQLTTSSNSMTHSPMALTPHSVVSHSSQQMACKSEPMNQITKIEVSQMPQIAPQAVPQMALPLVPQPQPQTQQIILVSSYPDSSTTSSSTSIVRPANTSGSILNGSGNITFELPTQHSDTSGSFIVDGNTDLFDQNLNYIKEEFILDDIDLLKESAGGSGSLTSDAPGSLSDEDHFMNDYSSHFDVKSVINFDHTAGPFMTTAVHHGHHHDTSLDFLFSEMDSTHQPNGSPMLTSSINGSSLAILVPSEPRNSFTDLSDIMSTMSTEYSNPTPGAGSTESDSLLIHDAGWNAVCEDIASMI